MLFSFLSTNSGHRSGRVPNSVDILSFAGCFAPRMSRAGTESWVRLY